MQREMEKKDDSRHVPGFAKVGNKNSVSSLGRNFSFITAKLLQLIRIINVEGRYSSAQLAQSRLLCVRFSFLSK